MQQGFVSKIGCLSLGVFLMLALAGCGGGSSAASATTDQSAGNTSNSPSEVAPGGMYVGYYMEDPTTNPEDPTPGAFVLNLPAGDAPFSGSMYFTYVGCQSSNVGTVSGTKSGTALSGSWTGTIDGLPSSGPYSGTYESAGYYHGVYSNSAGKQPIDIPGCTHYYIAPNGTWEMFPVEQNVPGMFNVAITGSTASWSTSTGDAYSLVYLMDPTLLQSGVNPIKWQTVVTAGTISSGFAAANLTSGTEYIAVVLVVDSGFNRIAFGSKRFTAS